MQLRCTDFALQPNNEYDITVEHRTGLGRGVLAVVQIRTDAITNVTLQDRSSLDAHVEFRNKPLDNCNIVLVSDRRTGQPVSRDMRMTGLQAESEDGADELIVAVMNQDAVRVQQLVARRTAITSRFSKLNSTRDILVSGCTYLHIAAEVGATEVVDALLGRGKPLLNAATSWGETPLYSSVLGGHLETTELLLKHDADPSIAARRGVTSLHEAVNIDEQMVRLLLRYRAPVNSAGLSGSTPLMWAVEADRPNLIPILISAGASVNAATTDGWTPLLTAVQECPTALWTLLKAGADPNLASSEGYTPLMRAAGHGQADIVSMLLDAGADPHAVDRGGLTARDMAIQGSHSLIAAVLEGRMR